jgi:tRNA (guanine37-N1)-methyltransferase
MQFEIVTIFPEFFAGPLEYGIVRRARETHLVDVRVHDLRAFAHDRHRTVDDRPFGGGEGMVLKPEPLFEAVESLTGDAFHSGNFAAGDPESVGAWHAVPLQRDAAAPARSGTAIVLLSASGKLFRQETARRFARLDRIILLCGRYEGVDERVAEHLATDELSIGDFVLSGGELPAALILDAVTRLIPGALGNEDSTVNESFSAFEAAGSEEKFSASHQSPVTSHESQIAPHESRATSHVPLDCPHYTRPAEFRGWNVPEVLLGGNHEEIRRWRLQKALEKTRRNRPDLISIALSSER